MFQIPELLGWWALPLGAEVVLLVLLAVVLVAQGAKHGWFYSFRKCGQKGSTPEWFPELHWTDRRMMWAMYALLSLAGCDVVRVLLAQSVARPGFQALIGLGATGKPFEEQATYRERHLLGGTWQTIEKGFIGRERLWLAAVNAVLLVGYAPFARWALSALSLDALLRILS
jgi:hypothetical protein